MSAARATRVRPGAGAGGLARALLAAIAGLVTILSGPTSQAFIPQADRTLAAIAAVNRAAGRTQALQLDLRMRIGHREPVAEGELVTHPTGLARLELRGYGGRIERYLLSGRELMATRNGEWIEQPRPLLQPLFLLQPSSETTLRAALETFGVISDAIGLAPCGDDDCFVIGDPRIAAPLPGAPLPRDETGVLDDALDDPLAGTSTSIEGGGSEAAEPPPLMGPIVDLRGVLGGSDRRADAIPVEALPPRLWVDTRGLEVRRIDRASGVFVIVGPTASFGRLAVPAWFEIHEPDAEPVRFDVERAVPVNAPPQAFSRKWLMTPVEPPASPDATPDGRPPGAAPDAAEPTVP